MKRAVLLLAGLGLSLQAMAFTSQELQCQHAWAPQPDSPEYRKYAPDRLVDILNLVVDITPDFKQRTIKGTTTLTFKPIAKPLRELKLDAIDLGIASVTSTEKIKAYDITEEHIVVTFETPVAVDKETRLTIEYTAQPEVGLFFRTPEMGYLPDETHLWTQGEMTDHRHWYPSHDFPNEKFSSEVICRVPEGMTVLSNGKLVSEKKDEGTGLIAVHWRQEKPHVNYLISIVAGFFKKIEDNYKDIPLAFYVPPSDIDEAKNSFRNTKDMMVYFEKEIGVPYPWEKYYQVVVRDFTFGGMENTSVTTLTDRTLFRSETENIRNSDGLVAHELAHQWFGNLITCKDWSHLWLNEGFATYYSFLYQGHEQGQDSMLYSMWSTARMITSNTNAPRPIVFRKYDKPFEQFSYLSYEKGAWVLHMLRAQLGEDLYRRCVKTFLERHQYDTVVTANFIDIIEELSGRSYDQFFDQWVFGAHHPELEAEYSWDEKSNMAKVSVKQIQAINDGVALFHFPLKIRFSSKARAVEKKVTVREKQEDFYFALTDKPESVVLDPDLELLAKIKFKAPKPMLHAQLRDKNNLVGRLNATEQIESEKDNESIAQLEKALNGDPFFGVRIQAARALQSIHNEEALKALQKSTKQNDARVRQQVITSIGAFFHDSTFAALKTTLTNEKNPDVKSRALRSFGVFPSSESKAILLDYLKSDSYRNNLADAAITGIRSLGGEEFIMPLQNTLDQREQAFSTRGFVAGLDTLAYLARHEEDRTRIREFLLRYVRHKKQAVSIGAITALGTLEDPHAIAVLETFASASKETPERTAAEKGITAIRSAQKPVDNLNDLRKELLELRKEYQDTRKEVNALTKKLEATQTPKRTPVPKRR